MGNEEIGFKVIVDLGVWLNDEYLEKIKRYQLPFLKRELEDPTTILILAGGHTNPEKPFISEAMAKQRFLLLENLPGERILLENQSIRTTHNLKFVIRELPLDCPKIDKIVFTGEEGSKKEVLFLAPRYCKKYLGFVPPVEYFGIPYLSAKKRRKKENLFPLIVIAYYFPPLDWLMTLIRWLTIRLKCFKLRYAICTSPFHLGCEDCKLKEVLIQKIRAK